MDKFTGRGLLYVAVSAALFSYEMIARAQPRLFLLLMYFAVILIGLVLIFFVSDRSER